MDFPSENGAARRKTNATLNWETGPLSLGWSLRYSSAYKQNGAVGGPQATQRAATGTTPAARLPLTTYTSRQGGDWIESQIYHDLLVSYSFDRAAGAAAASPLLGGLSVQLGVRNVFGKVPPLDAFYLSNYYLSPFGDIRLRSYWLNARLSI